MSATQRHLPNDWVLPALTEHNRPFFTAGTLRLQHCVECGGVQHPPAEFCFACGAMTFDYIDASPRGTISSHTIVHHAPHELLKPVVPYNVVVVQLDEYPHVQIVGNLVGNVDREQPEIGAAVVGIWTEALDDGLEEPVTLLQWRSD